MLGEWVRVCDNTAHKHPERSFARARSITHLFVRQPERVCLRASDAHQNNEAASDWLLHTKRN